jgi:hypothetical protein
MASNVTIAYLADVTDLRTKSAIAKAELSDVNAAVREQVSAFQAASDEAKGPALEALQALTAQQKELQATVAKTTAEIKKSAAATEHHAGVLGSLHERVKLAGEGFEHLTSSLSVFSDAAKSVGEFALAGLGLERAAEAINKYAEGAEAMVKLSAATGLTTSQLYALKTIALETSTPFEVIQGDLAKVARAMQDAADNADGKASRALSAMGINAQEAGFKNATLAEKIDMVAEKLSSYTASQNKSNIEMALFGRSGEDLTTVLNTLGQQGFATAEEHARQLNQNLSGESTEAAETYIGHLHNVEEEFISIENTIMGKVIPALDHMAVAFDIGLNLDQEIARTKEQIRDFSSTWNLAHDILATEPIVGQLFTDTPGLSQLQAQLAALEAQKAKLQASTGDRPKPDSVPAPPISDKSGNDLKTWKDELLQKQVVEGQFHAMSAAQEAAFWQTKIALTKAGSDEQREVLQEFENASRRAQSEGARAGSKAIRDEWQEYSASIKEKIDADKGHLDLQIALAGQWVAEAARLYKVDSKQYNDALKEQNDLKRQQAEQNLEISKEMAEAQANLAKIGEGSNKNEFKPSVGLAFDSSAMNSQVTAQVAQLRAVLDEQLAELAAHEKDKIDLGDTVAAAGDYKEATAALQEYVAKVAELNQQAANAVQQSWAKIGAPIEGAFSKIAGAAIGGGRQTGLAMEKAAIGVVQSWAKSGIEMLAHWVATQLGMTAASASGSAARVVAASPEEAATIAQLAAMLGKHISVEAAKTGATVTGVTIRTAATTAGAATAKAAEASAGSTTVLAAAGKAAAGTYASVAQIPYVGWLLAPPAAAAAYVAVAAYQTIASAEGGWDQVPYDNYPTNLHKDEMVLPRNIADSVRDMAASRAAPPQASASNAASSSSTINNLGGNSHSAAFSQTNHFHGSGADTEDDMREKSAALVHSNLQHWYGNTGTATLPGRQVRK